MVAGGLGSSERSHQQAEVDWRWSDEHVKSYLTRCTGAVKARMFMKGE